LEELQIPLTHGSFHRIENSSLFTVFAFDVDVMNSRVSGSEKLRQLENCKPFEAIVETLGIVGRTKWQCAPRTSVLTSGKIRPVSLNAVANDVAISCGTDNMSLERLEI
jgi:hypothetical protein